MFRVLPLLVALIALGCAPVAAQVQCGNRATMVAKLLHKYHEVQIGIGLTGPRLFEVWANCSTGTWTILGTNTNGIACLIAAGEDWQGQGCKPGQPTGGD